MMRRYSWMEGEVGVKDEKMELDIKVTIELDMRRRWSWILRTRWNWILDIRRRRC